MSDTTPSPPPHEPEAELPKPVELEQITQAIDQLGEALQKSVDAALNGLRTLMLEHYSTVNKRLESHAKAIRACVAEIKELRAHQGLPTVEPPNDDL